MYHSEEAGKGVGHWERNGVTPLSLFNLVGRLPMIESEGGLR